jgi:hypothetical protein
VPVKKVLKRLFGPKRDEVTGGCRNSTMRRLITCALHHIKMMKSRRMKYPGRLSSLGDKMNSYIILAGRPEGKIPLDVGGRIILR